MQKLDEMLEKDKIDMGRKAINEQIDECKKKLENKQEDLKRWEKDPEISVTEEDRADIKKLSDTLTQLENDLNSQDEAFFKLQGVLSATAMHRSVKDADLDEILVTQKLLKEDQETFDLSLNFLGTMALLDHFGYFKPLFHPPQN